MATCTVTGILVDAAQSPIEGAQLSFITQSPVAQVLGPRQVTTSSASDGSFSLDLEQGITGILRITYPLDSGNSSSAYPFNLSIPNLASARFDSVWVD